MTHTTRDWDENPVQPKKKKKRKRQKGVKAKRRHLETMERTQDDQLVVSPCRETKEFCGRRAERQTRPNGEAVGTVGGDAEDHNFLLFGDE